MILFGDEFVLSYSGIFIFLQFPQQLKIKFQFGRLSGHELIYTK